MGIDVIYAKPCIMIKVVLGLVYNVALIYAKSVIRSN